MISDRNFIALLERLDPQIKCLIRRWSFDAEVAAEASLSLWRHHVSGVVDETELLRRMDVDVRRYVRREQRQRTVPHRLRAIAQIDDTEAEYERLIAALDAQRACVGLEIPDGARAWTDQAMQRSDEPLTAAQRMYGRRWSARARQRLVPVPDGRS